MNIPLPLMGSSHCGPCTFTTPEEVPMHCPTLHLNAHVPVIAHAGFPFKPL